MKADNGKGAFRALVLITSPRLAERATALFTHSGPAAYYRFHASGTASSEIVDLLGLGNIDKSVFVALTNKRASDELLEALYTKLGLETTDSGIAFTLPLTGCSRLLRDLMLGKAADTATHEEDSDMQNSEYSMIAALINQGFSEDVVAAAKEAGARGGTVFHLRRITGEEIKQSWGLSGSDEKEAVLIITDAKNKVKIMQAISARCGIQSEAQGVVLSLPIDGVIGLGSTKHISGQ